METRKYLVPDYFPRFQCKMGECRNACCQGWPVSINMEKYFELLGADCPYELRQKLDCAMHLQDRPSPESYAFLKHRYDGNCYLRHPDGRCGLQVCMGEDILPDVCRLYPRGIRKDADGCECSCANSCEAVVELLLQQEEPIRFLRLSLPLTPPPHLPTLSASGALGRENKVRSRCIALLQDRSAPLPLRLLKLKEALTLMEKATREKDEATLDRLLTEKDALPAVSLPAAGEEELSAGLMLTKELTELLEQQSESLHAHTQELLARLDTAPSAFALYQEQTQVLKKVLPQWERFFEHLLTNHLFFSRFPFQDGNETMQEAAQALCVVYALVRFLCVGTCALHPSPQAVIDLCAAAFRLIDHTDFEHALFRWMKARSLNDSPLLSSLVTL